MIEALGAADPELRDTLAMAGTSLPPLHFHHFSLPPVLPHTFSAFIIVCFHAFLMVLILSMCYISFIVIPIIRRFPAFVPWLEWNRSRVYLLCDSRISTMRAEGNCSSLRQKIDTHLHYKGLEWRKYRLRPSLSLQFERINTLNPRCVWETVTILDLFFFFRETGVISYAHTHEPPPSDYLG